MARPRPEPGRSSRPRQKRSNACSRSAGSIPGPASVTSTRTPPPARPAAETCTALPGGATSRALAIRLSSTCSSAPADRVAHRPGAVAASTVTSRSAPSACHASARSSTMGPTSRSARSGARRSARARASSPLTSRERRSTSARALASSWPTSGPTSCSRFSIRSRSAVSGLRSWWEASATNCSWVPISRSRRDTMSLNACASSRTSAGPSDGSARTVRSPPSARRAASRRSVRGRLTHSASQRPATATATSTTSATPPRMSQ